MKSKLMVYLIATLITVALLCGAVAMAQTVLDPMQSGAYPYSTYLAPSCGKQDRTQVDVGLVAFYSAKTTCSTGGRGTKPRTYLACWRVTFADDRYFIVDRTLVLYATWLQGQAAYQCPALN